MPKQRKKQRPQKPKPQRNNSLQEKARRIHIGSVGKPHGVVGAFFVNDRSDQVPELDIVFIGTNEHSLKEAKVIRNFVSAKRPVLQIDLISNREELTLFNRQKIYAEIEDLDFDPEHEFFLDDVVGKRVEFLKPDGTKEFFGVIATVYETPANINVSIKNDQREIDLPLNAEYFDLSFDANAQQINLKFDPKDLEEFWSNRKPSKKQENQ